MASPYSTVIKGGPSYIGQWPYHFKCPIGTHVTKFNGRAGSQLDNIGIECSDGVTVLSDGGTGGTAFQIDSNGRGFQSLMNTGFNGGRRYQSFNGYGYTGYNGSYMPDVYNYRCPIDQYITAIDGSIENKLVKNLDVTCDYKASYCENNLESPYCKWLMPQLKNSNIAKDKAQYHNILNKACSINMSDTCRSNQTELDTAMVSNWCKLHMDDDFCACYQEPPDYIKQKAPEVAGLPQCWNNKCSIKGFKPITLQTCPTVTICRQEITTEGDSNLSSNVVVRQDCKPTIVTGSTGGTGSTTTSNETPINPKGWNTYVLLFVALIIFIVVIVLFWDDSESEKYKSLIIQKKILSTN